MAKAVRVISILAVGVCFCSLPAFVPGPARPARSMAPAAAGALSMLGAAPAFADKIDDAAKVLSEKSYPFLKEIDWTSDVYGKLPTQPPLEVLKAINTMLKMGASMDSAALKSGALAHSQAIANMDSKGVATLADYTAINGRHDKTSTRVAAGPGFTCQGAKLSFFPDGNGHCWGWRLAVHMMGPIGAYIFALTLLGEWFWWLWKWRLLGWRPGLLQHRRRRCGFSWRFSCWWYGNSSASQKAIRENRGRIGHGRLRCRRRPLLSLHRRRRRGLTHVWGPRRADGGHGQGAGRCGLKAFLRRQLSPCVAFAACLAGGRRLRWNRRRRRCFARLCGRDLPWLLRQRGLWRRTDKDSARFPSKCLSGSRRVGVARPSCCSHRAAACAMRVRTQGPGRKYKSQKGPKIRSEENDQKPMKRLEGPLCAARRSNYSTCTGPSGPSAPAKVHARPCRSHGCCRGAAGYTSAQLWLLMVARGFLGCGFEELGGAIGDFSVIAPAGPHLGKDGNFTSNAFGFGQLIGADKFYLHAFADEIFSDANVVMYNFGPDCNFAASLRYMYESLAYEAWDGGVDKPLSYEEAALRSCSHWMCAGADRARRGPFSGIRIGEANHPGPGGSRTTARKRRQASRGAFADEHLFGTNTTIDSYGSAMDMYRFDMWLGMRVGEAQNPGPEHARLLQGLKQVLERCESGAEGEDGDWLYHELYALMTRRPKNLLQELKSLVKQATRAAGSNTQARQVRDRDQGWEDWGFEDRCDATNAWAQTGWGSQALDWAGCDDYGDAPAYDWTGWWSSPSSTRWTDSWDAAAADGARAGRAVSYYAPTARAAQGRAHCCDDAGAAAVTPAAWPSWDAYGGCTSRRRWADLYHEAVAEDGRQEEVDPAVGWGPGVNTRVVRELWGEPPEQHRASQSKPRKIAKARAAQGHAHGAEEPWAIKREVWSTSAPMIHVSSVEELSKELDSAAGVSFLAVASSLDEASEMWDIFEGDINPEGDAQNSLALLFEHAGEPPEWAQRAERILVPGNISGKLRHRRMWINVSGDDAPSLLTRRASTFVVKQPPLSIRAQRASSYVVRVTLDRAYSPELWASALREPSRHARTWANSVGVKQADIIDAYGFAQQGKSRLTGLLRVRSSAVARVLWRSSGHRGANMIFFADIIGDERKEIQQWAKDEVVIQWFPWESHESFTDYHKRVSVCAKMGLVLGRGLGQRLCTSDPSYQAPATTWRAKGIPSNYQYADVEGLLSEFEFTDVHIKSKSRTRHGNDWLFTAKRQDRQLMLQQTVQWSRDGDDVSELLFVRESARRGPQAASVPWVPISEKRYTTFGVHLAKADKKPKQQRGQTSDKRQHQSPKEPPAAAPPEEEEAPRINKRPNPGDDRGAMKVDNEGEAPTEPSAPWAPLAAIHSNPGQGNCLYYALAQSSLGSTQSRTHRQMRRYAHQCLLKHAELLRPIWAAGGEYNTTGRPKAVSWTAFVAEVASVSSWGGCLELAAVCMDLNYRAWVCTSEGALHLINPDGKAGFVALRYDTSRQHWEAFDEVVEGHLREHYEALGGKTFSLAESLYRGGGALTDCASPTSSGSRASRPASKKNAFSRSPVALRSLRLLRPLASDKVITRLGLRPLATALSPFFR